MRPPVSTINDILWSQKSRVIAVVVDLWDCAYFQPSSALLGDATLIGNTVTQPPYKVEAACDSCAPAQILIALKKAATNDVEA